MRIDEVIKQLEDLKSHCQKFSNIFEEQESVWRKDVQALAIAIKTLEGMKNENVRDYGKNR